MRQECKICGKDFDPKEICRQCAFSYGSSICMVCCTDRGMCLERSKNVSGNEQRLVKLLEKEYNEKLREITISSKLVQNAKNPLIKMYFDKIASDIAKDTAIVGFLISLVKEGRESVSVAIGAGLTPEEVDRLRKRGIESIETYMECLHLAPNYKVRLMLKDLLLDEKYRNKTVKDLWSMVFNDAIRRRK